MDASNQIPIDETSIRYDGWRIVAVCFVVATFGWGFGFYGQSVYLAELHRAHGWPASLISGATTFYYLFGAVLVAFVAEAVRVTGASEVDVSSGVEDRPGHKDPALVRAFLSAVAAL